MIYAVDFDGTLCENCFPEIGKPFKNRLRAVKAMQDKGDKIILWTCRTGEYLEEALRWCKDFGVTFDSVNENLPEIKEKWGEDTRKIYCDFYIDDKNIHTDFLDLVGFSCL